MRDTDFHCQFKWKPVDRLPESLTPRTFPDKVLCMSIFKLTSDDFKCYGTTIRELKLPMLFIMEGGYAVDEIGVNAVNVLQGYEGL